MNNINQAKQSAENSKWLKAVSQFTLYALAIDGLAFWIVLVLALFGVLPIQGLLWPILIASLLTIFAFGVAIVLGLVNGVSNSRRDRNQWLN